VVEVQRVRNYQACSFLIKNKFKSRNARGVVGCVTLKFLLFNLSQKDIMEDALYTKQDDLSTVVEPLVDAISDLVMLSVTGRFGLILNTINLTFKRKRAGCLR
jgi:hypothetical protein